MSVKKTKLNVIRTATKVMRDTFYELRQKLHEIH